MATHNLGEISRQPVHILVPKKLRTDSIASTDTLAVAETHRRIIRRGHELACKTCPTGAELRQVDALAVGKLVLKHPQVRKPQIQDRRRVKSVRVSEDGRMSVDTGVTLTLCVCPPGIIGVAICLPVRVPGEQVVLVGKTVINTRVVLTVDASRGLLNNEVVL